MLLKLSAWCTQKPLVTTLLTVALVVMALGVAREVKIEAFPDVTNPQVMVIALSEGRAAEEVEREVTLPLERALVGLRGAVMQRSITSFGLVQVIVTFDDDTPIEQARQQVGERLLAVELPTGVEARMGPNDTPVGQIFQYTLEGDAVPIDERRSMQEWVLEKHLLMVPGVADVVSFGGYVREYHVVIDEERLKSLSLGYEDVASALEAANGASSGGYLREGDGEFVVRARSYLTSIEDIENVLVAMRGGEPILVRHLGRVVMGHTPRRGSVARGDAYESVEGIVLLGRGENPRLVLKRLRAKVDEINRDILPKTLKIVPFYDRTTLVERTLKTVGKNMLEGGLLVLAIIFVFLGSWQFALLTALVMPLSLLVSFCGLWLADVPANLLSMGAIDFGILLDGAVIFIERIFSATQLSDTRDDGPEGRVVLAAKESIRPTLFSMGIIVVAMLPIFSFQRVEGRIFRPMALTYVFALLGAVVVTFTIIPALAGVLLRRQAQQVRRGHAAPAAVHHGRVMAALERGYQRTLMGVLLRPWRTLAFGLALLVAAGVWAPRLGSEFLPQMNEGDLHITVTLPTTIALEEGQRILRELRIEMAQEPTVLDVLSEQGHPEDGTDDEAANQAKMIVRLHPQSTWPRGMTPAALEAHLREKLGAWPGIAFNFSQPIKDRVEEAISGVRGQVVVKAIGADLEALHAVLEDVQRIVGGVFGARDVEIYRAGVASHIVADIDRPAAARLGLDSARINKTLERVLGGEVVTSIVEDEKSIGVRLRGAGRQAGDIERIRHLLVARPDGGPVPLSSVACVHRTQGRTQINREALSRTLALKCNVSGRDLGSFVAAAQSAVAKDIALPDGVRLVWGGEFDNQRRAMRQLALVVPLSLLGIFVLLWATFAALMPAIVVLAGLPCACVGGIFALGMTQTPLSVSAAIGLITLVGVATLDGILLVSYARDALGDVPESLALGDAVMRLAQATSKRLRPVLMTALLASLGLLPAALSHDIGSDTQRPFAVVIIGGLLSATALTLFILPSLYWSVWRLGRSRGW